MSKQAQQIAETCKMSGDAMEAADQKDIAKDQDWSMEMTKYTFDDNSILAVRAEEFFAIDADNADSIKAYAKWLGDDVSDSERAEVERLLEAVE